MLFWRLAIDGGMACSFTTLSRAFLSYGANESLHRKVAGNETPFTGENNFVSSGIQTWTASLAGQRLTPLSLLNTERSKLYGVLAVLSAIGLPGLLALPCKI